MKTTHQSVLSGKKIGEEEFYNLDYDGLSRSSQKNCDQKELDQDILRKTNERKQLWGAKNVRNPSSTKDKLPYYPNHHQIELKQPVLMKIHVTDKDTDMDKHVISFREQYNILTKWE